MTKKTEGLSFALALIAMIEGKIVAFEGWIDGMILYLDPTGLLVCKTKHGSNIYNYLRHLRLIEIKTNNWYIVKPKEEA